MHADAVPATQSQGATHRAWSGTTESQKVGMNEPHQNYSTRQAVPYPGVGCGGEDWQGAMRIFPAGHYDTPASTTTNTTTTTYGPSTAHVPSTAHLALTSQRLYRSSWILAAELSDKDDAKVSAEPAGPFPSAP